MIFFNLPLFLSARLFEIFKGHNFVRKEQSNDHRNKTDIILKSIEIFGYICTTEKSVTYFCESVFALSQMEMWQFLNRKMTRTLRTLFVYVNRCSDTSYSNGCGVSGVYFCKVCHNLHLISETAPHFSYCSMTYHLGADENLLSYENQKLAYGYWDGNRSIVIRFLQQRRW